MYAPLRTLTREKYGWLDNDVKLHCLYYQVLSGWKLWGGSDFWSLLWALCQLPGVVSAPRSVRGLTICLIACLRVLRKLRRFYWKFYQFKSSKFCPFLFERPGKCCTHFFSGGKAAEERPRICVNLAICPQIVSGYTKRLLMHTKCCFIHCPINYLLTFWVVLVFHLRVGIVFHPTLFTASTWNTKTPVLQSDLRQRMDQYQPLWQFCCLCRRRNIGFIKKFPQLKAEL